MRLVFRILLAFVSLAIAYVVTYYLQGLTLVPLGHGHYEATPLTMVTFFVVFPLSAVCAFVIGNIVITRRFPPA